MKSQETNGNAFLKQVSKLFEDLAAGQKAKPPISPRITCTRLRRLREIRCELVETSDSLNTVNPDLESTVVQLNNARAKNESFASWVLRNKQAHQHMIDLQGQFCGQSPIDNPQNLQKMDAANAFNNFSPSALQTVAKNPKSPLSTLKWLAAHYKVEVRAAVSKNPSGGHEIMSILSLDGEDQVRMSLLENPALTRDLLLRLCDDAVSVISEKAKNMLYEQTKFAMKNNQASTENVPVQPAVKTHPNEISTEESEIIEREFLGVIAERSTTPPRRLAELAVHPDVLIRCMVAANPNATPEILWQLAKDKSVNVRRKLLTNYNCPQEIINHLLQA